MSQPKQPMRTFEGSAKPFEPFWNFKNAAESQSGETELEFYGPISEFSFWGDEVTPRLFKDQLYANGSGKPVTVRLNSPGGDLIAASVIAATIRDYPGKVTVKVDGLAASAAVMVALAGDTVEMNASAYMMIHNPMVGLLGYFNVDELKDLITELKTIKNGIVEGYQSRTKMEAEKLAKLMDDETWLTASEAVAFGFADSITPIGGGKASLVNFASVLTNYVNTPPALLADVEVETTPEPEPSDPVQAGPDPRQVERLRNYLKVHRPK